MSRFDAVVADRLEANQQEAELCAAAGIPPPQRTATEIGTEQRYQDLVRSLAALDEAVESSDVMQVFLDLARRQGARLLLLRQWSTGLRILLAEGVELPARLIEPRSANPRVMTKREHDLFDVLTRERVAYAGPVPVENVPRELIEALSVGEDQVALIVPLPLRGKWCTYVYLDWLSFQGEQLVQDAALLARHALLRLHALERDALPLGSGMREILGTVTSRRRERERNHFDGLRPGDLQARQVYEQVGEMTVMPQVAGRLLELINDQRATPAMLEKEIARDLVLAARLLRVANSSFYVSAIEIRSIRDAVVRLGFKTVRNWVVVNASRSAFPGVDTSPLLHRIWRDSLLSALASQSVAEHLGAEDREAVFVGGLMQNIGQLIMARALPGLYGKLVEDARKEGAPLWRIEQRTLGWDHGELGALLIADWGLGAELAHAVRRHHTLDAEPPAGSLATMIALGEDLAGCVEADQGGVDLAYRASLAGMRLGVDLPRFRELAARLRGVDVEACL